MRFVLLLACAGPLLAQAPIFTTSGPLDCGIRQATPGSVQTWCYLRTVPPQVLCNSITLLSPATGSAIHMHPCTYTGSVSGSVYSVEWSAAATAGAIHFTARALTCIQAPPLAGALRPPTRVVQIPDTHGYYLAVFALQAPAVSCPPYTSERTQTGILP